MIKLKIILLLTLNSFIVLGQDQKGNEKVILDFIHLIKSKQQDVLSNRIQYPFHREYPIPTIKNKQEFLNRYNEVFDDSLTNAIITSILLKTGLLLDGEV